MVTTGDGSGVGSGVGSGSGVGAGVGGGVGDGVGDGVGVGGGAGVSSCAVIRIFSDGGMADASYRNERAPSLISITIADGVTSTIAKYAIIARVKISTRFFITHVLYYILCSGSNLYIQDRGRTGGRFICLCKIHAEMVY